MDRELLKKWTGTKSERAFIIDAILVMLREERFPGLSKSEFNKLFLEAFCRNLVQEELRNMMAHIWDGD